MSLPTLVFFFGLVLLGEVREQTTTDVNIVSRELHSCAYMRVCSAFFSFFSSNFINNHYYTMLTTLYINFYQQYPYDTFTYRIQGLLIFLYYVVREQTTTDVNIVFIKLHSCATIRVCSVFFLVFVFAFSLITFFLKKNNVDTTSIFVMMTTLHF